MSGKISKLNPPRSFRLVLYRKCSEHSKLGVVLAKLRALNCELRELIEDPEYARATEHCPKGDRLTRHNRPRFCRYCETETGAYIIRMEILTKRVRRSLGKPRKEGARRAAA